MNRTIHLKFRSTKRQCYFCVFAMLLFSFFLAAEKSNAQSTAVASGSWSASATWGGTIPAIGKSVSIPSGMTVTVDVNTVVVADISISGTLTIPNSASSTLNYLGNLTVSGVLTNNGGIIASGLNKTFTLTGTYTHNPNN